MPPVDQVTAENPKAVEIIVAASKKPWAFSGPGHETDGGKANPQLVNKLLREKL